MLIFKEGRSAYLEFLRNLTPQAVILTFAAVAGRGMEITCCNFGNIKQTLIVFCFGFIWLSAAWANSSLFVEKFLTSVNQINRASKLINLFNVKGIKKFLLLLLYTWRKKRSIFLEVFIVFLVIEFGLVIVIMTAIGSAVTYIKLIHA